ncbi:MAG: hypothetical protein VXW58_11815 [Pseudomonadota bacterium]|nr:hypothetical protein [Pseudomonadota bacterium]
MRLILAALVAIIPAAAQAEGPNGRQIIQAMMQQKMEAETRRPFQVVEQDERFILLPDDRFGKLWEYQTPEKFFCEPAKGMPSVTPDYLCTAMIYHRNATVPNGNLTDAERIGLLDAAELRESRYEIPIVMKGDVAEVPDVAIVERPNGNRSFFTNPSGGCQTLGKVTGKGTDEATVVVIDFCFGPRDEQVLNVGCTMANARMSNAGVTPNIADPAFWQAVQPAEYVACFE